MSLNQKYEILDDKKPCDTFARTGSCLHGDGCRYEHHPNLDPASHQKVHPDFVVPNEIGTSCDRCLQKQLQCDKAGRDAGGEDPCSECRWFGGGEGADPCVVSKKSSVNDELWRMMMNAPTREYALPEQTHRLVPPKVKPRKDGTARPEKPPPPPMADEKVKRNWQGKSREELVDLPSWIPADMREHPRAYLVPARPSQRSLKNQSQFQAKVNSAGVKRPREGTSTSESQRSLRLGSPPFPQPAPEMDYGECVESTWVWKDRSWRMTYANGKTITIADGGASQHRPERQNEPRAKRPRNDDRPAQQRQPASKKSAPVREEEASRAMDVDQPAPVPEATGIFAELSVENKDDYGDAEYVSDDE